MDALRADAQDLRTRANELESESEGPVRRPVASWTGQGADRATGRRLNLTMAIDGVVSVYRTVATVLEAHAQVLAWAQQRAEVAIDLWEAGLAAAAAAGSPTLVMRPRQTNLFGVPVSPFPEVDAGAGLRRQAETVLAQAQREVRLSQSAAAQVLDEFNNGLPDGQFHFDQFLAGIGDWVAGLAGLVWKFNAIRAVVDNDAMNDDAREIREGLLDTGAHILANPGDAVPLLFDTQTMRDNPGRWWGRLAPDIALTAAGGVGVLTKTGAVARIGDNLSDLGRRVRAIDWADDSGVIDFQAWLRREPIDLTDGTQLVAATAEEQAAAAARIADLPEGPLQTSGPPAAYQSSVYGATERVVTLPGGATRSVDGITSPYGLIPGDAKLVSNPASSFYIPGTLDPDLGAVAIAKMDRTLETLVDVSEALGGNGVVEIVTNNAASAAAWEARMVAGDISGYVRLQP
nr:restriction endonuclease fold toxin-2 domain-containing protein [Actinotalea fermentans]